MDYGRGRAEPPVAGRLLLVGLVLVMGLALTALGWWLSRHWVETETGANLEKRVESLHGSVLQRVSLYDQALHATAAFVRIAHPTDIRDWAAFVDRLGIADNYPGIPALAYAPVIRRTEADAFVAEALNDGLFWFKLWPSSEPEIMVPNRFAAPLNTANLRALGYDMYQDPIRRAAMDAARDSGNTAITSRVILKIDNQSDGESAFIAYAPVYAKGAVTETVEQRRQALQGFTLSPIRMPTLIAHVVGGVAPDALVRVYDGPNPETDAVLHASPGGESVARWWRRDIHFSNRDWAVFYGFPATTERRLDEALPSVIVLFGVVLTVLLVLVLSNLVNSRGDALRMAAHMTRALRDSEAKFKAIFENSVQFASLLTVDGRQVAVNPAALTLVGGDEAHVIGLPIWEMGWLDMEAERERVRDALARAAAGELATLEVLRQQDGRDLWVDVSFKPVHDEDGGVAWIVAEGRDLTDRRQREETLNQAVDALTRSNQELERFAHVAAHDLQEPCRTIVSYSQLLERRFRPVLGTEGNELLDYLVGGAHRMRDLVTDLLAYSRIKGKAAPFETVDCARVMTTVVADLQRTITEAGAMVQVEPLPAVLGDAAQLSQLFLNLMGNALKFRMPDRVPEIRVSAERDGVFWCFSVSDNGIGIAPDYHERVFEIFQRLHGPDRFPGTGIGLAICRNVVERHGGRIWVEAEECHGSTFRFTLPASD
ncbi:MAG: CHASE domain-containing protein [Rhodospirillaceae bacterium]|nr:CHASE domain-containing protein [Rhodospirillales bacterium]